jgi:Flp pilus assembly protein TadG
VNATARARALRRRDEGGYVALLVAMFAATLLMPLCAISVDTARWYVEVQRVQNAADAAAMAGVTYLPDDFASAKSTAITVAGRNGYPASSKVSIGVTVGAKPTQLVVTINSKIGNAFGTTFGVRSNTISRSATADYNGPAPMGSPCNAFGNEPAGAVSDATDPIRGPDTSVIVAPPGGATCTSNPQFWGAVAGPDTDKQSGDQYMTRTCSTADGCTSGKNNEFDPQGYFYIVRVAAGAVNKDVTLQIYDPAWVQTGDTCTESGQKSPTVSTNPNIPLRQNMSSYVPADGVDRYAMTPGLFCTGDTLGGGTDPIVTSYALRAPTDTYQPKNSAPVSGCEQQYPGYLQSTATPNAVSTGTLGQFLPKSSDTTKSDPTKPNAKYNARIANVFHQWVALCTFHPMAAGDYYLQIRTNVKLGGTQDPLTGIYTNNPNVTSQTGDDTSVHGNGNNRFALRVKGAGASGVSVAGYQHMSIYANYTGANTFFNMVRVIPAAATKTLKIVFFDVGDAAAAGTIQVLPPTDSNLGGTVTGCTGAGVANGALANCKLTNVSSATYQGKQQVITVPIPSTYTCTSGQAGGCWYRLLISFPGGVTDTTTWSASIDGDPIRLIK